MEVRNYIEIMFGETQVKVHSKDLAVDGSDNIKVNLKEISLDMYAGFP
jgi:hypothetical protein